MDSCDTISESSVDSERDPFSFCAETSRLDGNIDSHKMHKKIEVDTPITYSAVNSRINTPDYLNDTALETSRIYPYGNQLETLNPREMSTREHLPSRSVNSVENSMASDFDYRDGSLEFSQEDEEEDSGSSSSWCVDEGFCSTQSWPETTSDVPHIPNLSSKSGVDPDPNLLFHNDDAPCPNLIFHNDVIPDPNFIFHNDVAPDPNLIFHNNNTPCPNLIFHGDVISDPNFIFHNDVAPNPNLTIHSDIAPASNLSFNSNVAAQAAEMGEIGEDHDVQETPSSATDVNANSGDTYSALPSTSYTADPEFAPLSSNQAQVTQEGERRRMWELDFSENRKPGPMGMGKSMKRGGFRRRRGYGKGGLFFVTPDREELVDVGVVADDLFPTTLFPPRGEFRNRRCSQLTRGTPDCVPETKGDKRPFLEHEMLPSPRASPPCPVHGGAPGPYRQGARARGEGGPGVSGGQGGQWVPRREAGRRREVTGRTQPEPPEVNPQGSPEASSRGHSSQRWTHWTHPHDCPCPENSSRRQSLADEIKGHHSYDCPQGKSPSMFVIKKSSPRGVETRISCPPSRHDTGAYCACPSAAFLPPHSRRSSPPCVDDTCRSPAPAARDDDDEDEIDEEDETETVITRVPPTSNCCNRKPLFELDDTYTLRPVGETTRLDFGRLDGVICKLTSMPVDRLVHHARLGEHVRQMYEEDKMADALIQVGSTVFVAHRAVLTCYSLYFADSFLASEELDRVPVEVRLCGVNASAFEVFLTFAYTGTLTFDPPTLANAVLAAEVLKIPDLRAWCAEEVKTLSLSQALRILSLSRDIEDTFVYTHALQMVLQHLPQAADHEEFLELDVSTIIRLLTDDCACVESELDIFRAALTWLTHDMEERRDLVEKVMATVRFAHMPPWDIFQCVELTDLIQDGSQVLDLILRGNWVSTARHMQRADPLGLALPQPRQSLLQLHQGAGQTGHPPPGPQNQTALPRQWRPRDCPCPSHVTCTADRCQHAASRSATCTNDVTGPCQLPVCPDPRREGVAEGVTWSVAMATAEDRSEGERFQRHHQIARDIEYETPTADSRLDGNFEGPSSRLHKDIEAGKFRSKRNSGFVSEASCLPSIADRDEGDLCHQTTGKPQSDARAPSQHHRGVKAEALSQSGLLGGRSSTGVTTSLQGHGMTSPSSARRRFSLNRESASTGGQESPVRRPPPEGVQTCQAPVEPRGGRPSCGLQTGGSASGEWSHAASRSVPGARPPGQGSSSCLQQQQDVTSLSAGGDELRGVEKSSPLAAASETDCPHPLSSTPLPQGLQPSPPRDILAIGGFMRTSRKLHARSVVRYCARENQWKHHCQLPEARQHHSLVVLHEKVYLLGGSDPKKLLRQSVATSTVFVFDPRSQSWGHVSPMATPRSHHAACVLDDRIYVIGGQDDNFCTLSTAESYDPVTNRWRSCPPLNMARRSAVAGAVGGRVLVVGGQGHTPDRRTPPPVLASVESFRPGGSTWIRMTDLRFPRAQASLVWVGGHLHLCGGATRSMTSCDPALTPVSAMDVYVAEEDEWRYRTDLIQPRYKAGAAALGEKIYIVGGECTSDKALKSVECYDTRTGLWDASVQHLPYPAKWLECVTVPMAQT